MSRASTTKTTSCPHVWVGVHLIANVERCRTCLAWKYTETKTGRFGIGSSLELACSVLSTLTLPEDPYATRRGAGNSNAKLTEADVREIRRLYGPLRKATGRHRRGKPGPTMAELGKQFNVTASAIHAIVSGKKWSHVK